MNDIIKGRMTRVRAGIVVAGAAAVITGGGLLLSGFGLGHQTVPTGVVKGQRVDLSSPDTSQCETIEKQIPSAESVDAATALACDKAELQADSTKPVSNICRAVNNLVINGNLGILDINLMLQCQKEEVNDPLDVASTDLKASALCQGAEKVANHGLGISSQILAACDGTQAQPSASPDGTDPSADPSASPDDTDPSDCSDYDTQPDDCYDDGTQPSAPPAN